MAADILIVRSHLVPVGKDQVQHLEMTRDMAGYFNQTYANVFPEPRELLGDAAVVPGTDGRKMSKSYGNTIELFAEGKVLKKTVMGIVTDSTPADQPKTPDGNHVFELYKLFATSDELNLMADQFRNPFLNAEQRQGRPFGYGDAKTLLLKKIEDYFEEARTRRRELAATPERVHQILAAGAAKARAEAQQTLALVRQAVGMSGRPQSL
jgi:tryptophanyl-tRNA synthetase